KALIYRDPANDDKVSTEARKGLAPWLIKFTSEHLTLGHEESLCEAAYLVMAKQAGLAVPDWELFQAPEHSKAKAWLAMRRFDCTGAEYEGRYHMHSLCGLLDADFRQPSMDYEDLIKASQVLCQSAAVGKVQFKRAIFNLFALNQDDHTKNWAFLMDDKGQWSPTPFYDVTFSQNPHNHHMTSFGGYGTQPSLKAIQSLADKAAYKNWKEAQHDIEEVVSALSSWAETANELAVSKETIAMIQRQLDRVYLENKGLLS
ncbi:MAG: type II toxin-antitoxin system HipA family toxin, partial [Leucothrix sp.]